MAGPPVELAFKRITSHGGHELTFDLDVRGGNATDLAIVCPFLQDRTLFEHDILTPATNEMRGIRISSTRPLLVLTNASAVVASVQVDLESGKPRVIGTPVGNVRVR